MSYYILEGDDTKGPFTIGQLRSMWNIGRVTMKTMHCREGDTEWRPLSIILHELEPPAKPPPLAAFVHQPSTVVVRPAKSRGVYIILGLFFGLIGIHNFYAGYYGRSAAQLIITVLLGWLIIGIVITFVWVLIDLLNVTHDANAERMI